MLQELVVEGLGVIERAEVHLARGCTALTGETGAGKTLVVAALGLLLGERADKGIIRRGSPAARVEGRFSIEANHPVLSVLRETGILETEDPEELEIVVSRTVTPAAGKARINGRLVTVATLGSVVGALVEIAGQNEHQKLSVSATQRELLDLFSGSADLAGSVAQDVRSARAAADRVAELRASERSRSRELDVLRYEIREIEGARLQTGEAEVLTAEIRRLESSESIARAIETALDGLRREGGADETLDGAVQELRHAGEVDPAFAALAERLEGARLEASDVATELASLVIRPDEEALEEARARLDAIAKLRRKYGENETEILAYLEQARKRAEELDAAATDAEDWEKQRDEALARAESSAAELTAKRRDGAARLAASVESRLIDLALPGASFAVSIDPVELYEGGKEQITFLATFDAGGTLRPIAKAASGGELSRLALALHLSITDAAATTLVFDEVDAGVGGQAARSVGRALADLADATGCQVVVVTHLPQVAAFADNHLMVNKVTTERGATASVNEIAGDHRVQELSRMLAGLPDSDVGREHARELLELAERGTPAA